MYRIAEEKYLKKKSCATPVEACQVTIKLIKDAGQRSFWKYIQKTWPPILEETQLLERGKWPNLQTSQADNRKHLQPVLLQKSEAGPEKVHVSGGIPRNIQTRWFDDRKHSRKGPEKCLLHFDDGKLI